MTVATGLTGRATLLAATAVLSGSTTYTSSIRIFSWAGIMALLVTLTGGGDNVTITQQCSDDDSNWYDPVDSDGNALGKVYTALAASKFIQYSPVLCKFARFKIVAGANSTVKVTATFKE